MIRTTNFEQNNFSTNLKFITEKAYNFLNKSKVKPNDLIMNKIANAGSIYIMPDLGRPVSLAMNLFLLRINETKANPIYVYIYLKINELYVKSFANGSVTKTITKEAVRNLEIRLPDFDSQNKIAKLYTDLTERISLLRETNTTLEAIAQTLFKSWFVDFDPVKAKAEGKQPEGMDEATAALFPSEFEESALGLIPKGWRIGTLGDVVETVGGATPSTKETEFWEPSEFAWTTPKDLSSLQSPILLHTERKLSKKGVEKINSGLLPVGTLLLSSRAPIGYLAITKIPVAINQGYIAMLPHGTLPPLYLLYWCRNNMDTINARANGSTFMEISKKAFRPIQIVVPSEVTIIAFLKIIEVLFDRLTENEKQSQTLTTLRDTLLPRLISGQLRINQAQDVINEVGA